MLITATVMKWALLFVVKDVIAISSLGALHVVYDCAFGIGNTNYIIITIILIILFDFFNLISLLHQSEN